MRILAVADIHGDQNSVESLLQSGIAPDLCLICGDITHFGGEGEASGILGPLLAAGYLLLGVSGNCDGEGVRRFLRNRSVSLEGRSAERSGMVFAGAGGGIRFTGVTPYERSESELSGELKAALENRGKGPLVIVTHAPPRGTGADIAFGGRHAGSSAVFEAVRIHRPLLCLCGHIHESPSVSEEGGTVIVNPGPLREGRYSEILLEEAPHGFVIADCALRRLP